jgi:hypothetical protein
MQPTTEFTSPLEPLISVLSDSFKFADRGLSRIFLLITEIETEVETMTAINRRIITSEI